MSGGFCPGDFVLIPSNAIVKEKVDLSAGDLYAEGLIGGEIRYLKYCEEVCVPDQMTLHLTMIFSEAKH